VDEFPKRRSPADSSAGLSDPWERDLWMLFEFLILESAQAGLSRLSKPRRRDRRANLIFFTPLLCYPRERHFVQALD
jgi:hypothetical protein